MPAILHLVNGDTLEVAQEPEEVARELWARDGGGAAPDRGHAALQRKGVTVRVNPRSVMYVEPVPQTSTRFS